MEYQEELEAAREAGRRAAEVIRSAYISFERIDNPPIDICTEADRAAQETILQYLHEVYPADGLCAEEQTPTLGASPHQSRRVWIVDPIDGTRGFASKNGEFSTMIALCDREEILLGLVLEPTLDRWTYAIRGQGCWRQDGGGKPTSCRVTAVATLIAATLVQSHSKGPNQATGPVRALRPARVIETYSAGVKLARVARGEADLYVNTYQAFHDWDIAAGQILVEEAGGKVSGLRGQKLRYRTEGAWQREGLLATNCLLHESAVAGMAEREGDA